MNIEAIKDLLFRLADDDLVIGHRMSEWTGIAPILEEDIAFSSIAQDEVGHAQAYYHILHEAFEEAEPDVIGFSRKQDAFRNSILVEQPIGDYAYSLVRHALYDIAESVRLENLSRGSFRPLAELAKKLMREERYHKMHAHTWIEQLGNATPESNSRLQNALNEAFPMALSLFEPTEFDQALKDDGIQATEAELEATWLEEVKNLFEKNGLKIPSVSDKTKYYGGRHGKHSEHLQPMLDEMCEVYNIEPAATW